MVVKRDPSDEPALQYRPPSTGTAGDLPPPPPPQLHHDGTARYLPPFEPHGRPPYQASYPPPQSPISATEQYHSPFQGPSRDAYPTVTYPANTQSGKPPRKATRAAQACDSCRNLKAKCDEGRPSCSSCKEKNIECRYRDPPPKQQDKTSADIMESLARIEQSMNVMQTEMATYASQMKAMQDVQKYLMHRSLPNTDLKQEVADSPPVPSVDPPPRQSTYAVRQPTSLDSRVLPSTELPFSSAPGQPRFPDRPATMMYEEEEEETEEEEGGDPGPPKPPSIPVNHTTGAARLLLEPAIAEMCNAVLTKSKGKNEKYPIIQEEKRGLLRLYGRGEGTDAPPGYDKDPLIDHGADNNSGGGGGGGGDTNSDHSSPAGEEWGQLGGMTPPGNTPPEFVRGINQIDADGMPNFSRETVLNLVQSYKDNINNMHPLLIPVKLDHLVESFLKSIPENQGKPKQVSSLQNSHGSTAGFVRSPDSPGSKRKRSPGAAENHTEVQREWDLKAGHPFRSISSALVLCVLALGSITQWRKQIPDCVPDRDDQSSSGSPTLKNGHPSSPVNNSPPTSTPGGVLSPQDSDKSQPRGRRTSLEGAYSGKGYAARPKNLDVIPGLAYFALATDIIGNQLGGNSLQHVHCNVLAGLYHGQLARVIESHAYIHEACRGLQVILRPKLDRFKRLKGEVIPAKDNPLVIAFWTCLQLESDIVAELPCPHSGILTYEDDMPGPNLRAASELDGFEPLVMESYSAQLFLRKHLNLLHNMFYRPLGDGTPHPAQDAQAQSFPTIKACEENLELVSVWAPNMTWNAGDPPATDILRARLRAKFYGAQVITYRPFLLKILNYFNQEKNHERDTLNHGEQMPSEYKASIEVPTIGPNATRIEDFNGTKILEYAKNCVIALINSTTAFHGLGNPSEQRFIVTNIWGTAHAQWGNLLCLQAAYKDPILTNIIDREQLRSLLETTISFLSFIATPSSALATDVKILKHTGALLNLLRPSDAQGSNTSFSSTTGDVPMSGH